MTIESFERFCRDYGYYLIKKDNVITITGGYNFNFYEKKFPDGYKIIFENNGYVNLQYLEELDDNVIFKNNYDVHLRPNIKVSKSYEGFQNKGNISPDILGHIRCKFYMPKDFYNFLFELKSNNIYINKLINMQEQFVDKKHPQISFVYLQDGMITFTPISDFIKKFIKEKQNNETFLNFFNRNKSNVTLGKKKYQIKIGKFLHKLFPEIKDKESEELVNILSNFKSSDDYEYMVYKGADIKKFYNTENQIIGENTRIFNSCMNWNTGEEKHRINGLPIVKLLDFYVENPRCSLLTIRKKGTEKSIARALMWETDSGKKYIEMTYVNKDSQDFLFSKYIAENECLSYLNGDRNFTITCPDNIRNLEVFPTYLDSLVYDKVNNIIKR